MNADAATHLKAKEFLDRLSTISPRRILFCSTELPTPEVDLFSTDPALNAACEVDFSCTHKICDLYQRYDLVIVLISQLSAAEITGENSKTNGDLTLALTHAKNMLSECVWLLCEENSSSLTSASPLFALGFSQSPKIRLGDTQYLHYQYKLSHYIRKKSWNNAKYWANPENWDKYRW